MSTSQKPTRTQPAVLPDDTLAPLASALRPIELSSEQRDRMRKRVLREAGETAPAGTITVRRNDAQWKKIGQYIEVRELERDDYAGTHVSLVRMHPGATVPAHRHCKDELFFILEGECHIGTHRLQAGDMHTAQAGSDHDVITTKSGVLVLVHGEYPYPGG